jgi:hypothetical protein
MSAQIAALAAGEELIDPATFAAFFSNTGAEAERRGPAPAEALLEAQIDGAASRAEATRLAVRLARNYCEAAAVFLVHRGIVQGIAAEGCSGRPETALFPKAMPSVFSGVVARRELYRGSPPERILERRVLRALGREQVRQIAVLPCSVGGRVVTLLYADGGAELLGDTALAALGSVAARLAAAYERLIFARKLPA